MFNIKNLVGTENAKIIDQKGNVRINAYQPLEFTFGNQPPFIKGMNEGLLQLEKGDKAYIFIPYELGYGEQGMGPIPAKSTLVFYVDIKP